MPTLVRPADGANAVQQAMDHLRSIEREVLRVYRPLTPEQERIHTSTAHELLVRGGKRAGKSINTMVQFASRVLGIPVYGCNNEPLPQRWPVSTPQDPRLYWVIGWDLKHIGQTIHRILFEPGLFRCIYDKKQQRWRTWNPADPKDAENYNESKPTEPLIPRRFIKHMSWNSTGGGKAAHVFMMALLKNGAKICAFPSSAKAPKMGDPVDGLLIDEDIEQPQFLEEYQDRLTDHDGWFMWCVWPQVRNFALVNLLERAEEPVEPGEDHHVECIQLLMSENPMIKEDAKRRSFARMGSEDAIARRDRGELLLDAVAMYDFIPNVHLLKKPVKGECLTNNRKGVLRNVLTQQGKFPAEWTRYLAIDPSHTRSAVMFGVVPPPEYQGVKLGNVLVVEDELVLTKSTAKVLAECVRDRIGTLQYRAFVMDRRIGQQTRVGADVNVYEIYAEEFRKLQLSSTLSGPSFIPACDIPKLRYETVRNFLQHDETGQPSLFFVWEKTPATQREFGTYRKKQEFRGGELIIMDEPCAPRKYDCMAALEYLVTFVKSAFDAGMGYVESDNKAARGTSAYRYAMKLLAEQSRAQPQYVHLGPGAAA